MKLNTRFSHFSAASLKNWEDPGDEASHIGPRSPRSFQNQNTYLLHEGLVQKNGVGGGGVERKI